MRLPTCIFRVDSFKRTFECLQLNLLIAPDRLEIANMLAGSVLDCALLSLPFLDNFSAGRVSLAHRPFQLSTERLDLTVLTGCIPRGLFQQAPRFTILSQRRRAYGCQLCDSLPYRVVAGLGFKPHFESERAVKSPIRKRRQVNLGIFAIAQDAGEM